MKNVAIILENGFEEIEAITSYDLLNRAGIKCDLVNTKVTKVTGAHGATIEAKLVFSLDCYDMIVLPGGMAICASPALVLTKTKVIDGKNVTCYPGMECNFNNSNYQNKKVVIDGKVITSQGPATSIDFALALIDALGWDSKSVSEGILY